MKRRGVSIAAAFCLCFVVVLRASGQQEAVTVQISIKDHRFQPSQITAPANRPIVIRVKNLDPTPMEFESVSLRVEKVVPGNSEGSVNVRALAPGSYKFFDDFHQDTGNGVLVVK
ncbi:MAG TPA: cupredoxin domain-containing protein [Xanthobacteraceae bacterium]|nr:cupredoxin domain-containing protein [Xanthobacteraceae bacterium]